MIAGKALSMSRKPCRMHGHWSERVLLNEQNVPSVGRLSPPCLGSSDLAEKSEKTCQIFLHFSCSRNHHRDYICTYVVVGILERPFIPIMCPELIYWLQVLIEKREASEASNCVTGSQQIKLLKF